ncbi:MAG TPA: precorrin-4 C(11)-methyltransferase, partial [Tepidimicrobium sp.]|nr:precorrin-4 C(11)-methyltransferase [Tepidimicrobium sp.]
MIYFIGAGPGDPELITVKGANLISQCQVIIYAGSLVNLEVVNKYKDEDAVVYDSAKMDLEDIIDVMKKATEEGKDVARVHTGDPSIYGAIREQMEQLKKLDIPYEVIPGVSSFTAAAAVLKQELTVPEVSQTVIVTRAEGRTPVPVEENLSALAKARATMAIFLSVGRIEKVVEELIPSYGDDTPVAVIYKASWEDEQIVLGTLKDIAQLKSLRSS